MAQLVMYLLIRHEDEIDFPSTHRKARHSGMLLESSIKEAETGGSLGLRSGSTERPCPREVR